ncbi:phage tail tape measure protein [Campylobacter jejuni]|uniref:Phage tail tape measure protein n=4 Tax=Campylobacter jejuni TaxID=197 RepID=A0A5T1ZWX3_CAMJU|nr:phage tail tape measure protein [Campylobacter jejuni]ELD5362548.1 phage tail tape measure protein [Campylobacter coli]EAH4638051.1 phage tail tape measure protein [Campylobacter jejuni]EAI6692914.1 phage tail tape measure protein [Campylobacter jejuni]EAJ0995623.1 phage tail tape measure protein [Campylobacter jejuni]EAJ2058408.1 phage tail tape measure protein [Campylobacter jejuni]
MENAGSIGIGVILGLAIKNASAVGKVVKDFSNLEKIAAKTKLGISGLQKELNTLKLNANLRAELKAQRKGLQDELFSLGNIISGGIVGKSIKVGIDFESAMADVKKVTDLSEGHTLEGLKQDILDLSKKLPMTAEEIANIVAEGGKLGLASKEALEFGKTATAMGVAFEMSANEAGEAIGGLMANLQTDVKGIKDLGDSINYLADKGSSDAKNIVNIVSRIGGMGNLIGLQRENMAALAATLDEVKIPAEVAGTAISSMFTKLSTADALGAKAEEAFSQLGLSGEFMKKALNRNSQEAINILLSRIKTLDKESQIGVITNIFGNDSGTIRAMATLVNGYDRYQELLKMTNSEEKKGSMDKELINKCETTASILKILGNNISALAIKFSDALLPVVKLVASGFSFVIDIVDTLLSKFPVLSTIVATATTVFLLAKPAVLAYAIAKNYLKDCTILLKSALIKTRIHLLAFRNSCILSNITLKAKTVTTTIYTTSLKALSFVLGGLNKVFKAVAIGIRVLSMAMMSNPIGLILGGIAIVAGLIIANWDKVKSWFKSFIEWLKPVWEPIYNVIKAVFDKCALVFTSFKDIIMSVASPLAEFLNSIWQGVGDFFYSIFGSLFDWFASKLSWVGDMISSISGFIKDALDFVGLGDDEEVKISQSEQNKEKVFTTNTYKDELAETKSINHAPSFNNGNINISVNGTFNIATKDGNFNMQEFANTIQKSVFDALRKQEQNKINTTIYG